MNSYANNEDIYALTDKEVFHRVVAGSTKKVLGSAVFFLLILAVARFYRDGAVDLSWLALVAFAIDALVVVWATILQVALLIARVWSDKIPRQTGYDIGATLVRLIELTILVILSWLLYVRFIR